MAEKYLMPINQDSHYHDPQTGLLKYKDEFEEDQKIEKERDRKLQLAITLNKIKAVNLDLKDQETSKLIKQFMKLWNQVSMSLIEFSDLSNEV